MDIANIIIALVSGLIGGNVTGSVSSDKNLGTLGNSISGLLGGVGGNQILQALGLLTTGAAAAAANAVGATPPEQGFDLAALITNIAGSGAGGAILTAIVGILKNAIQKPPTA